MSPTPRARSTSSCPRRSRCSIATAATSRRPTRRAARRTLAIQTAHNQLRADAEKAIHTLETSRARLAVYDKDLLSEAKESLDISRHAYEQGRGTLLDYLDAESSYRDVERAYRSAVADAMLADDRVRFVAGEELR